MPRLDFKQQSRINWCRDTKYPETVLTNEEIQLGAILRIANATELMAKNYVSLQADLEWYKKRSNSTEESYNNVCKSNNALRGHITRLKNKLNEKTKEIS